MGSQIVNWLTARIEAGVHAFAHDSLFRNAVFLMSSTAIMSVLGFGFWFFIAHLYTPSAIGLSSALISITLLISNLSFMGLNSGLVRFLPRSEKPANDINAALITAAGSAMVAAVVYLLIAHTFSGSLAFFTAHLWTRAVFVVLMAAVSLNTLTDSIFIANRRAEFHTIVYAAFGLVKLVFPLFLIPFGSLGIFLAYIAAVIASLALSLFFMWRSCGYRLFAKPNWGFIVNTRKFTTNNYIGVLLAGLPSQLMPALIIARIGTASAAYFAMAWTMANLLYVIPSAITNSLLAETSHDVSKQASNVRHAIRILILILVPAVVLAIVVAPFMLALFGHEYATGGTVIFQLLAVSTFFMAANSIGNTIMNIERRTGGIVVVQAVIAVVTLSLAWLMSHLGLTGIGLAIMGGVIAGNIVQLAILVGGKPVSDTDERAANGPFLTTRHGAIHEFLGQYPFEEPTIGRDASQAGRSSTFIIADGGNHYVLKVYSSSRRTMAELKEEIAFTKYLRKQAIPVPVVISNKMGDEISEYTAGGITWLAVITKFEEGQHPENYNAHLIQSMAQVQGRIHNLGLEYAVKRSRHLGMFDDNSLRSALLSWLPKGLSHFDYDGSNILASNDEISCVLDFEGMRYDSLIVCLAYTLTCLYESAGDKSLLETYVAGYQNVRPLGFVERQVLRVALASRYRSPRLLALKV
jgi:O-antigen/teichoic acid export membrane protein/Ser/Thr protein kinase RdoA (MazF antagonist)